PATASESDLPSKPPQLPAFPYPPYYVPYSSFPQYFTPALVSPSTGQPYPLQGGASLPVQYYLPAVPMTAPLQANEAQNASSQPQTDILTQPSPNPTVPTPTPELPPPQSHDASQNSSPK